MTRRDAEGYARHIVNPPLHTSFSNENDPAGNYAGASFIVDGSGRDLTEFDALTFWAKASRGVAIGAMGFGGYFTKDLKNNSQQVRLIEEACDLGVNVIDTAEIYVIHVIFNVVVVG